LRPEYAIGLLEMASGFYSGRGLRSCGERFSLLTPEIPVFPDDEVAA
jgi:hypothetical protein